MTLASSGLDARERRAARRERDDWSLENSMGAAQRFLASHLAHIVDGEGELADLVALTDLAEQVNQTIDTLARRLLSEGYSNREVGIALGLTRQAVALRYPGKSSRQPGAQPGALR